MGVLKIMTKTERFQNATQKVTYWDVRQAFNNLNERLRGEYYLSSKDLISAEGKKVPGFSYTGYAAGVGLRRILDALNIKYTTHMKGGSGVDEHSEIHIVDIDSQKRFLDILEKCGSFESTVRVELKRTNENFMYNPLFQQIR